MTLTLSVVGSIKPMERMIIRDRTIDVQHQDQLLLDQSSQFTTSLVVEPFTSRKRTLMIIV
jgi:hypothetical protein